MRFVNLLKWAWGLTLLLAIVVLFLAVTPAGGRLLVSHPYTATAVASLAFLRLAAWACLVRLPGGRHQLDWQTLAALTLLSGVADVAARFSTDPPIRTVLAAGGGLALFAGLTRRTKVGEIDEIETQEDGPDQTLRIIRLANWPFPTTPNTAGWGCWVPLSRPSKVRVVLERPMQARRDDRLFALRGDDRLEVIVRTKGLSSAGFQCHTLIVIVTGVFGKWLYIVGRFREPRPSTEALGSG